MAMILDAFLTKFSELLVQMVQEEVGMLLGIPGQIEKLGETVHDIQCVLADAERKQSQSSVIQHWLLQLKDVMYDADEIIDLCQIKAMERLGGSISSSSTNARYCCSLLSCFCNPVFAHEIGFKIKDINSRLEGIAKKKSYLGLNESQIFPGPSDRFRRVDSIISRKTDPSVVLEDIVGEKIEKDNEMLVNWLINEEKGVTEKVGVVAIVGMGGIGKTTLVKRIFHDPRIDEDFELKIWACVSKEVKGVELLKCVIREAGGEHGAFEERSELVPLLQELVHEKKFLLVLDDVWQESQEVWDSLLRTPMSGGSHGSKLLITTRDERVANRMRATKSHRVDKLSDEDGWSLLIKQVDPNGIESEIQDLKEIGMQIVKKCDGLPLALKSIGGVLCTKGNTKSNWEAVLGSNAWSMDGLPENVHHALYLSYEDLPPHLKQCFIFCSLFPEDFVFGKSKLIYLWLAEGFLHDKRDFWELGNEYYMELLKRNLLEVNEESSKGENCKMHDILQSFAHQLGKDENCVLSEGQVLSRSVGSMKVRRLSIRKDEVSNEVIRKGKGLRALVLRFKSESALDALDPLDPLDDTCKNFSNLRILELSYSTFSNLPDGLCDLVHLRYLDVSNSMTRNLPNFIGNLKCLQFLNLAYCKDLSHVPHGITNLQELKMFSTYNSGVKAIPAGLNKLDKLVELYGFKPAKNNLEGFSSLDGIETLSQLLVLHLKDIDQISDKYIAKKANLVNKNRLRELQLIYTSLSREEQLSQTNEKKMTAEDVVNELCPPCYLEKISIKGYFGRCLPNWLNLGAALPKLQYVEINSCVCFEGLAPLGQLPNLDFLRIKNAYSVVSVGEEFLWGGIQSRNTKSAFPKLSCLTFDGMPNWIEWLWNKEQQAMPKLKKLYFKGCPQLRSLPDGLLYHATSLEYLEIGGADKLTFVENFPSLKRISIVENPILERISNLPSITKILSVRCPNLKVLENLNDLKAMELVDFEMKFLPEFLTTTMPQKLKIRCSEELLLKIASQREGGSEWNKLNHIHKVKIYSPGESLYATYQKEPFSLSTNLSTRFSNSMLQS